MSQTDVKPTTTTTTFDLEFDQWLESDWTAENDADFADTIRWWWKKDEQSVRWAFINNKRSYCLSQGDSDEDYERCMRIFAMIDNHELLVNNC